MTVHFHFDMKRVSLQPLDLQLYYTLPDFSEEHIAKFYHLAAYIMTNNAKQCGMRAATSKVRNPRQFLTLTHISSHSFWMNKDIKWLYIYTVFKDVPFQNILFTFLSLLFYVPIFLILQKVAKTH